MRIAILSWESLHSIFVGGLAVHVSELASALERKGLEVHIFTRKGDGQTDYEPIDGVHYHRCSYHKRPDFIEETRNMCRAFVDEVIRVEDAIGPFDLVHAHDWLAAEAMFWIKKERGRRVIYTVHSTEYGRSGNNFYDGMSARIRDIERAGAHFADRVITVSHTLKDEIKWMYEVPESKVSVVYNGVNMRQFDGNVEPAEVKIRYGIDTPDPMVLFVGRLVQQKGPDLLLETIPSVLDCFPGAKFVFAGDGDMRSSMECRAETLHIAHSAKFVGFKSGKDLIDLYKSCDVVCVPSRNEPFGIFVLEAWSAEKPVVTTKNGGTNEYIRHRINGIKIDPEPSSISWGLNSLLADPESARSMGREGRLTVESTFNWDTTAEKVLEIYDRTLEAMAA